MSSQRSIAIVGAGIGGLACARILQLQNISVTVYEREPTVSSRQQGGSLDMHSDSGFKVLEMAQLVDEFKKVARYDDQNIKIVGIDGTVHFGELERLEETAGERPEVDRVQLRQLFLDSLKPGTVKWNHGVSKVVQDGNDKAIVHFLESTLEPATAHGLAFDPPVSSTIPEYSGVAYVDIFLRGVEKDHPNVAAFVKGGLVMVLGDNKGIIAQRNSNDVVRVYAAFRKPLAWFDEVGLKSLVEAERHAEARELLLKQFEGWCPEATSFLQLPYVSLDIRPLYTLNQHGWDTNPHITILGDAAHVPFSEGANNAMLDGAELATVIADNLSANADSWQKAIKGFEDQMQSRAWAEEEGGFSLHPFISEGDAAARAAAALRDLMAESA
ncbi:hypothetical protein B0H14DRAFT_3724328 [Mycena olivaceomarginata]|nr:hypothetical protein B0H14DRAFT_3724328 [Mycena olivaceomarginata]